MKEDLSFLHEDRSRWPRVFSELSEHQPYPEQRLQRLWDRIESDIEESTPVKAPATNWSALQQPYLAAAGLLVAVSAAWFFWQGNTGSSTLAIDSARGLTIQRSVNLIAAPDSIQSGDSALLTREGYLDLSLSEKTRLTFEGSRMDFEEISSSKRKLRIHLREGSVTISSSDPDKDVVVTTPNGSYQIVGTIARLQSSKATDRVDVLEGQVMATVTDSTGKETVLPVVAQKSLRITEGKTINSDIAQEAREALIQRDRRLNESREIQSPPTPSATISGTEEFHGSKVKITLSDGQTLEGILAPRLRGMPYTIRTRDGTMSLDPRMVETVRHVAQ